MSHDVFISHSSIDKNIADAACATLESRGIRCWIAPRDIRPGDSWGASIVKGIEESRVMVIIFSESSNASKQVMREVERAIQKDVVVMPFRIDGVKPSADMEYFLSATHWLDAMTPKMDGHLEKLATAIKSIIDKAAPIAAQAGTAPKPALAKPSEPKASKTRKSNKPLALAAAVLALLLAGLWLWSPGEPGGEPGSLNASSSDGNIRISVPKRVVGAESVEVKVSGKPGANDYIMIGKSDSQDSSYLKRTDVAGGKSVSLEAPDEEGLYEVRYFDGAKRAVVARLALKVNAPEVTLDSVAEALAGTEINVAWKAPNNKGDYISIAAKGSDDSKYATYAYTTNGSPTTIRVPSEEGSYEIRYISGQGATAWARRDFEAREPKATISAQSSAVAGSDVPVDWTGPLVKGDFVAIAESGSDSNRYVSYKYPQKGQKLAMRAPDDAGVYEVRYISGGSYIIRASAPLEVTPAVVEIEEPGEVKAGKEFSVKWTGPGYQGDYIAIYPTSDGSERYLSYQYSKKGSALRFKAPEQPGTYELKYISGQQARVWAIRRFTVVAEKEAQ